VSQSPNQSVNKRRVQFPLILLLTCDTRHEYATMYICHVAPSSQTHANASLRVRNASSAAVQRSQVKAKSECARPQRWILRRALSCRTRHPNQVTRTLKPTVSLRTADRGKPICPILPPLGVIDVNCQLGIVLSLLPLLSHYNLTSPHLTLSFVRHSASGSPLRIYSTSLRLASRTTTKDGVDTHSHHPPTCPTPPPGSSAMA
jgi:hypothetical protein